MSENEIAKAEQRVERARIALANHKREWPGADAFTCFAQEDLLRKRKELVDAQAELYAARMAGSQARAGWKLAYIA